MFDPSAVLRQGVIGLSRNNRVREALEKAPISQDLVGRFVAGPTTEDAVRAVRQLDGHAKLASVHLLAEDATDRGQAAAHRDALLDLLAELADASLADGGRAELSLDLGALGLAVPRDGAKIALEHARAVCQAAAMADTTVTLDMEEHTSVDATLEILGQLRRDYPGTGVALQVNLRRTEADCRDLVGVGSRVRLCKGVYPAPAAVAFQDRGEIDMNFVKCMRLLMEGKGYPMIASHDPRIIEIAGSLADKNLRSPESFEYQMLFGVRPKEQQRLADAGNRVRVYVPYGEAWYPYVVRRLAERPANGALLLRSVTGKR